MKATLLLLLIGALYFNWRQHLTNQKLISEDKHCDSILYQQVSANLSSAAIRLRERIRNPWTSPCTMTQRDSFLSILKGFDNDSLYPIKKIELIKYIVEVRKLLGDSSHNFYTTLLQHKLKHDSFVNQPFNPILDKLQMTGTFDLILEEVFRRRTSYLENIPVLIPLTHQNAISRDYEAIFIPYFEIDSPKEAIVYLNNKPMDYSDGIYDIKFTRPSKGKHGIKLRTMLPLSSKDTSSTEIEYNFKID